MKREPGLSWAFVRSLVICALILALFTGTLAVNPASAYSVPSVVQETEAQINSGHTLTISYPNPVSRGNVLIVQIFCDSLSPPVIPAVTSDSQSLTWSPVNSSYPYDEGITPTQGDAGVTINTFYSQATSDSAESLNLSCVSTQNLMWAIVYEVTNVAPIVVQNQMVTGLGTTVETAPSPGLHFGTPTFLIAQVYCYSCSTLTPGGGFTQYSTYGSYYGTDSTVSSPTQFPSTPNANTIYGISGTAFTGVPPSVIVVAPCTAFELQCWLYPFFVFGIYMILVTGMARFAQVPSRDLFGHLLEAFTIAGLLCVIMGILNVMIPLIITIVQVVRALRD